MPGSFVLRGVLGIAVAACAALWSPCARASDIELGAYLASECVTCHHASGAFDGIPAISGLPEADFIEALRAYKSGQRPNEVMRAIASRLAQDEMEALAAYFAALGQSRSARN